MVRELPQTTRYESINQQQLHTHQTSYTNGPVDDQYTLEDAINIIGLGKFQYFVMALTGLLWLCASIELMCTSVLLIFLRNAHVPLTNIQENILTALPFLGDLFGAFMLPMFSVCTIYKIRNMLRRKHAHPFRINMVERNQS